MRLCVLAQLITTGLCVDFRFRQHKRLKLIVNEWNDPKQILKAFEKTISKFQDSKLVVSYRDPGIPGIEALKNMILSYKKKSSLFVKDYKYALTLKKKKVAIDDIVDHGYKDIAGLSYHNGYLYMVSDSENLLIKYDLKNKKTISKKELPDFAQEGVTFDDHGYIYFADDNGRILKYSSKGFL